MTRPGPPNLQGLPTLTEVLVMPSRADGCAESDSPPVAPARSQATPAASEAPDAAPAIGDAQWVERVLVELQRHADLTLDLRLREALAPVLARLTESLIRDVRKELTATLRDVVARAVEHELARQRSRGQ
jgi:hypothetical protein